MGAPSYPLATILAAFNPVPSLPFVALEVSRLIFLGILNVPSSVSGRLFVRRTHADATRAIFTLPSSSCSANVYPHAVFRTPSIASLD